jgi:hypothetical protein
MIFPLPRRRLCRNVIVRPFGYAQDRLRRRISSFVTYGSVKILHFVQNDTIVQFVITRKIMTVQ